MADKETMDRRTGVERRRNTPRFLNSGKGALLCVTWITVITIAIALFASDPVTENLLRPLYFAGLLIFFVGLGQRAPSLRSPPYRMIEMGLLCLFAGQTLAAVLRYRSFDIWDAEMQAELSFVLDRGIGFLLGFSLIAYGIVLWVPELLESQRVLQEHLDSERQRRLDAHDVIARQEALVTVGELAAGVAHELRNPLAIMRTALQTLREDKLDAAETSKYLEVMDRAVQKANRRITGLLDLGKAHPFAPDACSVDDLLHEALDLVRPEARQISVEVELGDVDESGEIYVDRQLLLQVLVNLLRNALQAGPHGGPIRVGYTPLGNPPGACRISVEDHGRGVPEEILGHLFTPFFTTKPDGTGLGLNVSAQLIEKHGGKLWLESRSSGGTRACIELPGRLTELFEPTEQHEEARVG